jgi:hypothetical protein
MELKGRIIDLLFCLKVMNRGLRGCEERGMMIMVVNWEKGSWHIMRGQGR